MPPPRSLWVACVTYQYRREVPKVWCGQEWTALCGWLRRPVWALACTVSPPGDTVAPFCPFWGAVGEAVRRMLVCLGDG